MSEFPECGLRARGRRGARAVLLLALLGVAGSGWAAAGVSAGGSARVLPAASGATRAALPSEPATRSVASAAQPPALGDYRLAAGDNIRILVFQNPDLTLDTRVSESGTITYPLAGTIGVGGLTLPEAERRIGAALKAGNFLKLPQVNIVLTQVQGNQVSVLGLVNRPGRFPLLSFNARLSDLLASAGGIVSGAGSVPGGADQVVLVGWRDGKPFRREIDLASLIAAREQDDPPVAAGDVIYVPPAPVYYVYGEVQRPGSFRLKRGMTVRQALADGGGPTPRGTQRGLRVDRRAPGGAMLSVEPRLDDPVQPDDVLYVRESWF